MKRRAGGWLAALLLLGGLGLWLARVPGAVSSTLSPNASGWLAARLYLEGRGASVALHDGPFSKLTTLDGVLVVGFP
ncbi:MAG: hypothetical protein AAF657_29475, partial [Acidobacteriota bacterium]